MPIFTLTRRGGEGAKDKKGCYRKIVRAADHIQARHVADMDVGAEGRIWKLPELTSCKKIRTDQGRPYVLCEDHYD